MPTPISGTAIVQAATQLRIIELDAVLDENISTSMNFAIDYTNQTFRMTGLQFTNWLNGALAITAANTSFDGAIFESYFVLDPPPENVQDAIDFGIPILFDADRGNIGKSNTGGIQIDETVNGFCGATGDNMTANGGTKPDWLGTSTTANIITVNGVEKTRGADICIDSNQLGYMAFRNGTTALSKFEQPWYTVATTEFVDNGFLPLTGGTLSGDGQILTLKQATPDGGTGAGTGFLQFNRNDGTRLGFLGDGSTSTDYMQLYADISNVDITAALGDVDINAPTGNVRIDAVNIAINAPVVMDAVGGKAKISTNYSNEQGVQFNSNGVIFVGAATNSVVIKPNGLSVTTGQTVFNTAGDVTVSADITAFNGVAANAQPAIAATGQTTAYDLIELMLNKIETLENRIDVLEGN